MRTADPRYAPGHTTAAGLGYPHQQARQRALRLLRDGDLCARCEARGVEHPMSRDLITRRPDGRYVSRWLDLDDFPGRAVGGPQVKRLSFKSCNRAQGAMVTNRAKAAPRRAEYTRW